MRAICRRQKENVRAACRKVGVLLTAFDSPRRVARTVSCAAAGSTLTHPLCCSWLHSHSPTVLQLAPLSLTHCAAAGSTLTHPLCCSWLPSLTHCAAAGSPLTHPLIQAAAAAPRLPSGLPPRCRQALHPPCHPRVQLVQRRLSSVLETVDSGSVRGNSRQRRDARAVIGCYIHKCRGGAVLMGGEIGGGG